MTLGALAQLYQSRGFWARRKCVKFTPPLQLRRKSPGNYQMSIAQDEIEKIAALARIRIDDAEMAEVTARIGRILDLVDKLQAVDTAGVEPMANPHDASQRLRRDEVTEDNQREAFQAIAPAVENGLYLVPRVVE